VVLGNVYTLMTMRWCENSSEAELEDYLTMLPFAIDVENSPGDFKTTWV